MYINAIFWGNIRAEEVPTQTKDKIFTHENQTKEHSATSISEIDLQANISEMDISSETNYIEKTWVDNKFSLAVFISGTYDFQNMFGQLGICLRWWPWEHVQVSLDGGYGSFLSLFGNLSYWVYKNKIAFYIGCGGGGVSTESYGLGPAVSLTTGIDYLISNNASIGLKINAGYAFATTYYFSRGYGIYNKCFITIGLTGNLILFKKDTEVIFGSGNNKIQKGSVHGKIPKNYRLSIDGEIAMERINLLVKSGLETHRLKILEETKNLAEEDRIFIYKANKRDWGLPLLLNGLLGFGIGSFVEGDKLGGGISPAGDILGAGLIALITIPDISPWGTISASIGGLIIFVNRVFQIIRPITFTIEYNDNLRGTMNLTLAFEPVIQLASHQTTYGALLTARF